MKRLLFAAFALAFASATPSSAAPDEFAGGPAATLRWRSGATDRCNFAPLFADRSWKFASTVSGGSTAQPFAFTMKLGD